MTSMVIAGYGFMDLIVYGRNIVDDLMTLPRMKRGSDESGMKDRKKIQ